jgi:hypothetical protein
MLRSIGTRLPISAQKNPNSASTPIHTLISLGKLPLTTNPPVSAASSTKTGSGIMPMRNSMIRHQPSGQKRVDGRGACATGLAVVVGMADSCSVLESM